MSNYICDGCEEQIPPQKARMHCQSCPDYDSCTNCYVLGIVTGKHTAQHPITLVRNSGVSDQPPPSNSRNGPGSFGTQPARQNTYGLGQNPPYTNPTQNGATSAWTPLFNAGSTPSPSFVTMMQQVFACLDPSRTGYLTPEAYSSFMEVQGYPTQQIIWKNAHGTAFANKESTADLALKSAYELCSIEHLLKLRHGPQPQPQNLSLRSSFANLLTGNITPAPTHTNPMPLLTLRGFIDGTAMEILTNPSQGWAYLNRALHYYQIPIWREKGDIPREMIPMVTPPAIQARQNQIQENAMRQANNQLETAQMMAEIQRRGNEAAVAAIGGSHWEYRY